MIMRQRKYEKWRVCDIRYALQERLGREVPRWEYQYLQKAGIVPLVPKGYRQWDAVWTNQEAMDIIQRVMESLKPTKTRLKYRRPGYWKPHEIRAELKRRFGIDISKMQWEYMRTSGVVPEPELRIPALKGGWTTRHAYSDAQFELIVYLIQTNVSVGSGQEAAQ